MWHGYSPKKIFLVKMQSPPVTMHVLKQCYWNGLSTLFLSTSITAHYLLFVQASSPILAHCYPSPNYLLLLCTSWCTCMWSQGWAQGWKFAEMVIHFSHFLLQSVGQPVVPKVGWRRDHSFSNRKLLLNFWSFVQVVLHHLIKSCRFHTTLPWQDMEEKVHLASGCGVSSLDMHNIIFFTWQTSHGFGMLDTCSQTVWEMCGHLPSSFALYNCMMKLWVWTFGMSVPAIYSCSCTCTWNL